MAVSVSVTILIVSLVLNIICLLAVVLRFTARHLQKAKIGIDDYIIIPAALTAVGIGISNTIGVGMLPSTSSIHLSSFADSLSLPQAALVGNLGLENWAPAQRLILFTKTNFATIALSVASLALSKYSIVSFYRRIFRKRSFIHITTALLVIIAAWGVGFFLAVLLQCVPVSGTWDPAVRAHAHCYSPLPAYYAIAISDTIVDVIILIVPQPLIWSLQMPMRRKVAISGIFLLGTFVLGIGAARIELFYATGRRSSAGDKDPGKSSASSPLMVTGPLYWTHIECTLAVVCACLPAMRVIFLEATFMNMRILRSFASKVSIRSSRKSTTKHSSDSERQSDSQEGMTYNLPEWKAERADSLSSVTGTKNHRCEIVSNQASMLTTIEGPAVGGSGIMVEKVVQQQHVE
ncbi:hypothetical protein F5Y19DRAFT_489532 [Xylariaceae sp. FL1651]|nr:hypothetical protein F5Y19DRAFT_489532 [Xylariaceae sp. FL1651]